MSLRLRLSLVFALVVAAVVAALGATLYLTMHKTLENEMDRRLSVRADEVQYALWPGDDHPSLADLTAQGLDFSPLADIDAPSMQVQVLDTSGRLLKTSDNLHGQGLPVHPAKLTMALHGQPAFDDVTIGDRAIRVLSVPVRVNKQVAAVLQVSQSRVVLEQTMTGLRRLLIAIGSAAVLLAGAIGWCVSYAGLRPLSAISRQAADIALNRDFRRRLRLGRRRDEIGKLAETIDGLLRKVEETLQLHRDFLADTSHELRNPLLAIRTNAGLLNRLTDASEREECVQEVQEQAQRMTRLISDLLLLAQMEHGLVLQSQPVDVLEIVERTVHEARLQSHGQRIRVQHAEPLRISADPHRLSQILVNLLDNAIKHTASGQAITVRSRRVDGGAQVEVEDTGEGISPEHLPRIFERAYRVNPSFASGPHASYGLGLAIVKYLTEAHGGRVEVRSELGRGTCFSIWQPASMEPHCLQLSSLAPFQQPLPARAPAPGLAG